MERFNGVKTFAPGRVRALEMSPRIPSEISFDWVYFAPFLFTVLAGFTCAYALTRLLNVTGLSRFFWQPGIAFLAWWVLLTSLIGLVWIHP